MTATLSACDVLVHVPPAAGDAVCWAKALTAVQPGGRTGHALEGEWLNRGTRYELPPGVLVVSAEKYHGDGRMAVMLWRVDPDHQSGLAPVHTWSRKSTRVGPSILGFIARRLNSGVPRPSGVVSPIEPPQPNRRRGRCQRCDRWVPVGEGLWVRGNRGWGHVEHRECPPPDRCPTCGDQAAKQGRDWRIAHLRDCPERPPEYNRRADYCVNCWGRAKPGDGLLRGGPGNWWVEHPRWCPANPLIPDGTWIWHVREIDQGAGLVWDYPTGTVVRTAIPDDSPQLPGVSVVGVVVAAVTGRRRDRYGYWRDTLHTVWRAATVEEAGPVLDGERERLYGARLLARARALLALHPLALPADAQVPPRAEVEHLDLSPLPATVIPAGADVEVVAAVDERRDVLWTVIRNTDRADWSLSNLGGWTVVCHPLTPERRTLLAEFMGNPGLD